MQCLPGIQTLGISEDHLTFLLFKLWKWENGLDLAHLVSEGIISQWWKQATGTKCLGELSSSELSASESWGAVRAQSEMVFRVQRFCLNLASGCSFLFLQIPGGSGDGSRGWVTAIQMRGIDRFPGSWLRFQPRAVGIWDVIQQLGSVCLCLSKNYKACKKL